MIIAEIPRGSSFDDDYQLWQLIQDVLEGVATWSMSGDLIVCENEDALDDAIRDLMRDRWLP